MSNTQKAGPKTLGEARAAALAHPLVAAIVAAPDIPHEDVPVPEWPMPDGSPVVLRVRGLDGKGRDAYEAQMFVIRSTADEEMRIDLLADRNSRILAKCLFDPATDLPLPISIEMLGAKSGDVIQRLAKVALGLSGLGPKAKEESGKDSTSPGGSSDTD